MKYYKREFLNRDEGVALVEASIEYEDSHKHNSVYAAFKISDCNRSISLEFSVYDDDDHARAVFKVDALLAAITDFKANLEQAKGEYDLAQFRFKCEAENEQA